jgi:hypothetical protein
MATVAAQLADLTRAADLRRLRVLDLDAALRPQRRIMGIATVSLARQLGALRPLLPPPFLARTPIAPILPLEGTADDPDADA